MTNGIKSLSSSSISNTVQEFLPESSTMGWPNTLTLTLSHEADDIPPWGVFPQQRDLMLREFWPTTPEVSGAISTLAARNSSMTIKIDGPPKTVGVVQDLLHNADFGAGITSLLTKLSIDLYTQDNGAFLEIVRDDFIGGKEALRRTENRIALPKTVGLNHLDAAQCLRTGDPINPVIYIDPFTGTRHLLPWHMVIPITEMPSPIRRMRGMQYCALTRVLRAAQLMRDIGIYKREKLSGRSASEIQIVGGPSNKAIEDAVSRAKERADNRGLLRYMEPIIVASLDPTKPVSVATIGLASLPDGFDADVELKNYITILALCLLEDYQTFAPLPGGNLGTSQQSAILDRKARGKGSGLWRKIFTHIFNFSGFLPQTVTFSFDERDPIAEREEADAQAKQIDNVVRLLDSGIINVSVARQYCADHKIILDDDLLALLGDRDQTATETITDEDPDITAMSINTGPTVSEQAEDDRIIVEMLS